MFELWLVNSLSSTRWLPILSLPGTEIVFLPYFVSSEVGLTFCLKGTCRCLYMQAPQQSGWGPPKIWLDRNLLHPFAARALLTVAGSQRGFSKSFFGLPLGVAWDLGRKESCTSLGKPLASMGLFNTIRNIYCCPS